jgi:hypothetical protein
MDKSMESLSDIANVTERLCKLVDVRFEIYDLKGSLQRVYNAVKAL